MASSQCILTRTCQVLVVLACLLGCTFAVEVQRGTEQVLSPTRYVLQQLHFYYVVFPWTHLCDQSDITFLLPIILFLSTYSALLETRSTLRNLAKKIEESQQPSGDASVAPPPEVQMAVSAMLEAEANARMNSQSQATAGAGADATAGVKEDDENPTAWWPKRTEFAQALNEMGSKVGGDDAQEFWWLANAPWFLPPPPEWGPIKPEMYAQYYFKPIHHNYELPNVEGRKAPWFAPNHQPAEGRHLALGVGADGISTFRGVPANAFAGPSQPPDSPYATMGVDVSVQTGTQKMGGRVVPGSEGIPQYGDTGVLGGHAAFNTPYTLKDCNPYFPQSCGAYHPGWHPEPPRQAEFQPAHDAPTYAPEMSKLVPPLGGSEAFLEISTEIAEAEADADQLEEMLNTAELEE